MTYKQEWQLRYDAAMHAVCKLLKWTDEEYLDHAVTMGEAYLMWYMPINEAARMQLHQSKEYWGWYKNQYLLLNESWVSFKRNLSECNLEKRLELYDALHCPRALVRDSKPSHIKIVTNETKFKVRVIV